MAYYSVKSVERKWGSAVWPEGPQGDGGGSCGQELSHNCLEGSTQEFMV